MKNHLITYDFAVNIEISVFEQQLQPINKTEKAATNPKPLDHSIKQKHKNFRNYTDVDTTFLKYTNIYCLRFGGFQTDNPSN